MRVFSKGQVLVVVGSAIVPEDICSNLKLELVFLVLVKKLLVYLSHGIETNLYHHFSCALSPQPHKVSSLTLLWV